MNAQATTAMTTTEELDRVIQAARDSLTDDMVTRLAATMAGAMDLMDKINRSGLADAIPPLARMVQNGDLDRLAELARVVSSAQDALTDDMVARLSETAGSGLDFMDQVSRARLDQAIPALARMVHNGDLDRLVELARVVSSAQDALTDDMVSRLSETIGQGLCMLDRLNRYGIHRLIAMLEKLEATGSLERLAQTLPNVLDRMQHVEDMFNALDQASREMQRGKPASGGLRGIWHMMSQQNNQEVLRFMFELGKQFQQTSVTHS